MSNEQARFYIDGQRSTPPSYDDEYNDDLEECIECGEKFTDCELTDGICGNCIDPE